MPSPETPTSSAPLMAAWPAALTRAQVAIYLNMSGRWIDMQAAAGAFPKSLKFGRASRWLRADVDAWLEQQRVARR